MFSFLAPLPDIIWSEFYQLGVQIQHLNIRARDSIATNPNGCCIHFGRLDDAVISVNVIDISIGISKTSSTDPIEMATTHNVPNVNRAYVDMLPTNVICGNIVTTGSADGNIYVSQLCRCAVFSITLMNIL